MLFLIEFIICSIIGTIGHFLYKLTNNNIFAFIFSKGESIYDHLKLGFTPLIIFSIINKFKFPDKSIISIYGMGLLIFSLLIILLYLLNNYIIKKDTTFLNISSFYLSLLFAYVVIFLLFNSISLSLFIKIIGIIVFIFVILSYFLFYNKTNTFITKEPKQ